MTTAAPAQFKITYTTANVDMDLFHRLFDEALAKVRSRSVVKALFRPSQNGASR